MQSVYSARCGHKNLIQHLIPRPKEFNLGLIFQKTIFWCYNARKAHAVCQAADGRTIEIE